jgi:hypothetical protein
VTRAGCSCRDPDCGQPAKHPLGTLVPHGVKDATTNRARALAWWTRHPQANIGLATGHTFDVLDVDGPVGAQAIQELAAAHGFHSSGPLVRTGGGGWHYYVAPTGLWIGGAGAAMWSPHPAGTPPDRPTSGPVAAISILRCRRSQHRCEPGWNANRQRGQLARWNLRPPASPRATAMPERP